MAKQTTILLVDDIDGSKADTTVRFAWQGTSYEIDLSAKNARAFEAAIDPYVSHATRVAASRGGRRSSTRSRADLSDIRAWANRNGHALASRGRIPASIVDAYRAAAPGNPDGATAPGRKVAKKAARKATGHKTTGHKTTGHKTTGHKAAARKAPARKAAPRKSTARQGRRGAR